MPRQKNTGVGWGEGGDPDADPGKIIEQKTGLFLWSKRTPGTTGEANARDPKKGAPRRVA